MGQQCLTVCDPNVLFCPRSQGMTEAADKKYLDTRFLDTGSALVMRANVKIDGYVDNAWGLTAKEFNERRCCI